MTKDSYHHGNLRQALVEAGIDLLEEVGLEQLSLRAIAARVGVSHTAPKNHFGSFQGLLTAMAAEGFRRHTAHMRGAGPDLDVLAAAEGYVAFARNHPNLYKLMFAWKMQNRADPDLAEAGHGSYLVLQDVVRRLGIDDSDSPAAVRAEALIWSLVHGYAALRDGGVLRQDPDGKVPDIREMMSVFNLRPEGTTAPDR